MKLKNEKKWNEWTNANQELHWAIKLRKRLLIKGVWK